MESKLRELYEVRIHLENARRILKRFEIEDDPELIQVVDLTVDSILNSRDNLDMLIREIKF